MMIYSWFAKAYNWTPAQVDELSLEQVHWLPVIEEARVNAEITLNNRE